jgi:hypothetical protein
MGQQAAISILLDRLLDHLVGEVERKLTERVVIRQKRSTRWRIDFINPDQCPLRSESEGNAALLRHDAGQSRRFPLQRQRTAILRFE